jgi:hypothetical protein
MVELCEHIRWLVLRINVDYLDKSPLNMLAKMVILYSNVPSARLVASSRAIANSSARLGCSKTHATNDGLPLDIDVDCVC